jgi:hypothetical protein
MGKMHELLATEEDILGTGNKIIAEAVESFKHKSQELYFGRVRTYTPNDPNDPDLLPKESKELIDTVPSKLRYVAGRLTSVLDFIVQKEGTNQSAVADITVNGVVIAAAVPVNALLSYERWLVKVRELIALAPTLPNGPKWELDSQKAAGTYKLSEPTIQYRTRKTPVPFVLHPGTDKHPPQVIKEEKVDTVGQYSEMQWCSGMTSHDKAIVLEKVDSVVLAVKQAIRRANDVTTVDRKIGQQIFDFILKDLAK